MVPRLQREHVSSCLAHNRMSPLPNSARKPSMSKILIGIVQAVMVSAHKGGCK